MSGSRDRLGLLLPLPALLALEPTSARAHEDSASREDHARSAQGHAHAGRDELAPEPEIGPCLSPPMPQEQDPPPTEPESEPSGPPPSTLDKPSSWTEAPPTPDEVEVRALFERGRQAFDAEDYRAAATAFEQAAAMAPDQPALSLDAAIAHRHAALQEQDPERAGELCEATRRQAEATIGHPQASEAQAQRAQAESAEADRHCTRLQEMIYGPCLSVIGPCLEPPYEPRGCAARSEPIAMLGSLMLLGFARRRRDAVERVAQRLPPDVAARLRRRRGEDPDADG